MHPTLFLGPDIRSQNHSPSKLNYDKMPPEGIRDGSGSEALCPSLGPKCLRLFLTILTWLDNSALFNDMNDKNCVNNCVACRPTLANSDCVSKSPVQTEFLFCGNSRIQLSVFMFRKGLLRVDVVEWTYRRSSSPSLKKVIN